MKDKLVREWIERGSRDFDTAKLIFEHGGHLEGVVYILQQAVEKYLKGYLIWHGWKLKKIHDIETLLTEAIIYDDSYRNFLDIGRKLTGFYYEGRYPPFSIPDISKNEVEELIKTIEKIISKIKSVLNLDLVF